MLLRLDPRVLHPLQAASFTRLILLPQCALLLIAQDRRIEDTGDTYEIMRESSRYGYHHFLFDSEVPTEGQLSLAQMVLRDNLQKVQRASVCYLLAQLNVLELINS